MLRVLWLELPAKTLDAGLCSATTDLDPESLTPDPVSQLNHG